MLIIKVNGFFTFFNNIYVYIVVDSKIKTKLKGVYIYSNRYDRYGEYQLFFSFFKCADSRYLLRPLALFSCFRERLSCRVWVSSVARVHTRQYNTRVTT